MFKPITISKTNFLNGLFCPRYLWFIFNVPEKLPQIDEADQHLFDQGYEVGNLAKTLYPKGVEIPHDKDSEQKTKELLKKRIPLFEATFTNKNSYCKADILVPVDKDEWDLIEVKSSADLKDEHIPDIAFQLYCIQGAGIKIRRAHLMHINNEYVRKGKINAKKLFTAHDATSEASELSFSIEGQIERLLKIIRGKEPKPELGVERTDHKECPICRNDLPENNVTELYHFGKKAYQFLNDGGVFIKDIPDDSLNEKQLIQKKAVITRKPHIEPTNIKKFLKDLKYPLYFLDFETISPAIPLFDGTRPFQSVPFQLSINIIEKPGAKHKHVEFLIDNTEDPRKNIVKSLRAIKSKGTVLAYNMTFEKRVIEDLFEAFPKEKHLRSIVNRLNDLIIPFRSFWYYDPKQHGSCSLKAVLPALTGRRYEHLEISQGDQAARKFLEMTYKPNGFSPKEKASLRQALLIYCKQDTKGMVEILKVLEKASKK